MRRQKVKIGKILMIVLPCVVLAIAGIYLYANEHNKRTGPEWFELQSKYMGEFQVYSENMDDIFALYITGTISADDFANHLNVLKQELDIMSVMYHEELKAHPIKTGTHNYSTKKACEAVEDCYRIFDEIITMGWNNMDDVEALSYKYITYQQEVIDNVAEYMAACNLEGTEEGVDE